MNQTELEKHNKDLIQILLAIKPMTTDEVMGYVNKVNKLYSSLIETERSEAVIEYRINFEKGVQHVVENTVAKDRVEEIRKKAVKEFAKWLNRVPITVVGDLELGYYISKHLTQTEGKK